MKILSPKKLEVLMFLLQFLAEYWVPILLAGVFTPMYVAFFLPFLIIDRSKLGPEVVGACALGAMCAGVVSTVEKAIINGVMIEGTQKLFAVHVPQEYVWAQIGWVVVFASLLLWPATVYIIWPLLKYALHKWFYLRFTRWRVRRLAKRYASSVYRETYASVRALVEHRLQDVLDQRCTDEQNLASVTRLRVRQRNNGANPSLKEETLKAANRLQARIDAANHLLYKLDGTLDYLESPVPDLGGEGSGLAEIEALVAEFDATLAQQKRLRRQTYQEVAAVGAAVSGRTASKA